jgi:hypothetical protein
VEERVCEIDARKIRAPEVDALKETESEVRPGEVFDIAYQA